MSRSFNINTPDYLSGSHTLLTAYPVTISAWFYPTSNSNAMQIAGLSDNTSAAVFTQLRFAGSPGTNAVQASSRNGATVATASSSTGATVNAWNHGVATFTSATRRDAYLNGGNGGNNTTSRTWPTANTFSVGATINNTVTQPYDGRIAEVGIWNVVLDADEISALAKGICPNIIRPSSLISYYPLIGEFSPEIDVKGGLGLTVTTATKGVDHSKIIYSQDSQSWRFNTAVSGGSGPKIFMNYYRMRRAA